MTATPATIPACGDPISRLADLIAERLGGTIAAAFNAPRGIPMTTAQTMRSLLPLLKRSKLHNAEATRRDRHYVFERLFALCPEIADAPLHTLTPLMCESALDHCWGGTESGYNKARSNIGALINYAIRKQLVDMRNPIDAIDPRRIAEAPVHALHPEGLRNLFTACKRKASYTPYIPYIALCAFAGVRPAEAARLTWGDIDMHERIVSVRAANSKTGGTRHIPMADALRDWLDAYRPDGATRYTPIAPHTVSLANILTCIREAAGFGSRNPWQADALRHSYATYYLKRGGNIQQLQLNMGHRNTSLLYTRYVNMAGITRRMAADWWHITPNSLRHRKQIHTYTPITD